MDAPCELARRRIGVVCSHTHGAGGTAVTPRGLVALALAAVVSLLAVPAAAEATVEATGIEDFAMQPETRWRFFTDGVMGGSNRACVEAPSNASGFLGSFRHVIRCGRVSGLEDAA